MAQYETSRRQWAGCGKENGVINKDNEGCGLTQLTGLFIR